MPTIEHLAELLIAGTSTASHLIPIQTNGGKRPFFFLHGDIEGGGFYCRNLSRHLGDDQPFFALPPLGLGGEPVPSSIQEMAIQHLAILHAFQPKGPYRLGGFCNGGVIAFEMARLLEAQGEHVEKLILIHSSAQNIYFKPLHRIVHGAGRRIGAPHEKRRHWFLKIRNTVTRQPQNQPQNHMSSVTARQVREYETMLHYGLALGDYIPGRYKGFVHVLWPEGEATKYNLDGFHGWSRVAPHVKVTTVPGNHLSCLTHESKALADQIRLLLAE